MNNNIPQGYKDSPLGVIPQDWEVRRLGEVCSRIGDGIHGTPHYVDYSDYVFINGNNLVAGKIKIGDDAKFVSKEEYDQNDKNLDSKTILLSINGTIGNIALYNGEKVMLSKSAAYLKFKENVLFYFQLMQSDKIQNVFTKELSGSTIKNLSLKSIREALFALPPIAEQERIAEVLRCWDVVIEKQVVLVDALARRKRALMQQLLTARKRLPNFSAPWQSVKLGNIAKIKKGEQVNKVTLNTTGNYPTINGGIEPSGYSEQYNTECNTITISEGGNSCGFVNLIKTKFWSGGHCYTLAEGKDISKSFLFQILKYRECDIMRLRVGSGLPNIQLKSLSNFEFTTPPLEEQKAIAQILTTADQEIKSAKTKLEALRTQKRGLMQQLLTGKKRLRI